MGTAVEGKSKIVTFTPVTDTAIYASGDQIGAVLELAGAMDDSSGTGTIVSVVLVDKDKQAAVLELLLFNRLPTVTSVDQGALDVSDAEMAACFIGSVRIAASDYTATNVNSVASVKAVNLLINSVKGSTNPTGSSIWALLRSGGTPTYTSTSALVFQIGIKQD